ncbi:MAG TPA: DUF3710 domain-containing protein [Mycobacteriales bacterium]|nr:DUF3710 domain-containing protein [Mycobacteriales bacterium]
MALGRRSRRSERAKLDATPPWQTERERDTPATTGPWDEADAPDDDLERLDLGALRIPVVAGVEIRVDVSAEGQVVAATLSHRGSEVQVGVFAAPRTAAIWDQVRAEIRSSIAGQGGTAQDRDGRFGAELAGRVPVQGGFQSMRFVGVDGPRWFVRALFTGPAATDPARAATLEDAMRNIVVVRGSSPMPVREPLPLQLPKEVAEQAEQARGAHAAVDVAVVDEADLDAAGEPVVEVEPAEEGGPLVEARAEADAEQQVRRRSGRRRRR